MIELTPDLGFINKYVAHVYESSYDGIINAVAWNVNNLHEIFHLIGYIPVRIIEGNLYIYGRLINQYDIVYTRFPYEIDRFMKKYDYDKQAVWESNIFVIRDGQYKILPEKKVIYTCQKHC